MKISIGIRYMLLATVLFTIMQGLVKYLDNVSHYHLIFARSVFSFVVCYYQIRKLKISPFGNDKKNLFFRGLTGAISLTMFFYAIQHMPMASVIAIVDIKPLLIIIVAFFILGEKFRKIQLLFLGVSFVGVLLIKGFDDRIEIIPFMAAIGAAVFASFSHTLIRKLRNSDKPEVILFYFTFITLPIVTPLMIWNWTMPQGWDWLILFLVGLLTHLAQLCLMKAFKHETVSNLSPLYYLGIVTAFIIGYFFFDETYDSQALYGIGLVIIGLILNLWLGKVKTKSSS